MPAPSMFDSPRAAIPTPAALRDYIQPNLSYGLRIWWAFYWPTILCEYVLTLGVNRVIGRYLEDPLLPARIARALLLIARYDMYFFYYLFAFLLIGAILRKNFRQFHIALLSNHGGEGAQPLPPTVRRVARVWWTFSWRTLIYRIILTFVATFPLGWMIGFLEAVAPGPAAGAILFVTMQVLIEAAVGMYVIYSNVLDEDISDFRVALVPPVPSAEPVVVPPIPENLAH